MSVLIADSTNLARQLRRWHPFLAVPGDTKWADNTLIDDPGDGLATKNERRTARLAGWRAVLDLYSNDDLRDLGYNGFETWAKPCKPLFADKIRAAMGNPEATVGEMRTWVRDQFALWELVDTAPGWAHNKGCSSPSLHMGNPATGTTSVFGAPVTAAAWGHMFSEIELHFLEALFRSQGQEDHFLLLDDLPDDWVGSE